MMSLPIPTFPFPILIFIFIFTSALAIPQDSTFPAGLKLSSKANNNGGNDDSQSKLWCVAKNNAEDTALQSALDWACGEGKVDCSPIQPGSPCYDPQNFQSTATFAFNDYYQRNGRTEDACNFGGTAALFSLDPSHGNCKIESSSILSVHGGFTGSATGGGGPISTNKGGDLIGDRLWCQGLITTIGLILAGLLY